MAAAAGARMLATKLRVSPVGRPVSEVFRYHHRYREMSSGSKPPAEKLAEELLQAIKEPASEGSTQKLVKMAEDLLKTLKVPSKAEGVAPLTLSDIAMRDIERRTNKLEIGYAVMSGLVFCLGSVIAGIHVQEKALANTRDMKVARLEEKSTSADNSITRMDRKMLQLEYHLKATQNESPCCNKLEATTDGASPVPEAAVGGVSPGLEAGTGDSPPTWWKWFFRG